MSGTVENVKIAQKPGRTLLVNDREKTINVSQLVGLVSSSKTTSESVFLEFDTVENAEKAFEYLKNLDVRVKYAYYKLFLKITSNLDQLSYDQIKEGVKALVECNVLYFKLYKKDEKLIGSGDFTIDRLEDLNNLIKKTFEAEVDGHQLKFDVYRFRIKKKTV